MSVRALLAAGLCCSAALAQLPPPVAPLQNPQTPEKIMLGKILFWDEQLSSDDSMACGTCHLPEFGGSDGRLLPNLHPGPDGLFGTADDIHGSTGIVRQTSGGDFTVAPGFGVQRQVTGRTSPTTLGAAYHADLFWDGRASSQFDDPETGITLIPFGGALESQAVVPILSAVEMGVEGRTWQDVRNKLQAATPLRLATALPSDVQAALLQNPTYPLLFQAAFGTPQITGARIGMALASYQRTLVPDDTPWDRYMAGQQSAMTPAEKTGWALFQNQGRCISCHFDALFSDDQFHNLGLRPNLEDPGRQSVTAMPDDLGAFKTPTLRNAGLRPRLFHNGQSPGLADPAQWTAPESVLNIYWNGGGVDLSNIDPFMVPLNQFGVTQGEVAQMLDFVRTALTDARAELRLAPFDHPDLRSLTVPAARVFGSSLAGAREPLLIDTVPAFPGNADYKVGLAGGDGAGFALLLFGSASIEPDVQAFGVPWNVLPENYYLLPMAGLPGEPGRATWRIPIPALAPLPAGPFHLQHFVLDPLAPGGLAASRGLELFVQ